MPSSETREDIEPRPRGPDLKEPLTEERLRRLEAEERLRRLEAEARASDLEDRAQQARAELSAHLASVRYRLGHALILALKPSMHTLALPGRLAQLLIEGWRRWRSRRQARSAAGAQRGARPSSGPVDPEIERALSGVTGTTPAAGAFAGTPPLSVRRPRMHIAAITDEFSWACWQYEANLHPLTPSNWASVLQTTRPDLLLVESPWAGPGNSWQGRLINLERQRRLWMRPAFDGILAWCHRQNVPTVFVSKEDPAHFDVFLDLAKGFDVVLTSDADCVPEYQRRLGHARVGVAPLAAQPRLHNPIMDGLQRSRPVFFAGTWYAAQHSRRQRDAEAILLPATEFGLDIFDRLDDSALAEYRWPEAYRKSIRGMLPYSRMVSAYKLYRAGLNLNSVAYSPTMGSRRLFELLACGTPVLSSHARSIRELFGDDVVLVSHDAETTRQQLSSLLADDVARAKRAQRGTRAVLARHTYGHRMNTVLSMLGMTDPATLEPTIALLAPLEHVDDAARAYANFSRQAYRHCRLVLCARDALVSQAAAAIPDPRVERVLVNANWGAALNAALDRCDAEWVGLFNPRDHYGADYLTDHAHATLYAQARVIGKGEYHSRDGNQRHSLAGASAAYRHAAAVAPWTVLAERLHLLESARKAQSAETPAEWARLALAAMEPAYSSDPFNYVQLDATSQSPPAPSPRDQASSPFEEALA